MKKISQKWMALILLIVLLASNLPVTGVSWATPNDSVPKLLITELVVNPKGAAPDLYEFVEIYNNSNIPVSMQDYSMTNVAPNLSKQDWVFSENKVVQPYQSIVVWVRNISTVSCCTPTTTPKAENSKLTNADFLKFYNLPLDTNMTSVESNGGMINSDTRTITILNKSDNREIVKAKYVYTTAGGAPDGKADVFKYPADDSINMQNIGNAIPTPGVVDPTQVPAIPAPPDKSTVPDLLITELVTNPAGPAPDLYEFIELYNNSDSPISPTGYSITSLALDGSKETWRLTEDKMIQPHSTMIVWVQNATSNGNLTLIDFLNFYKLQMRQSGIAVVSTKGGMPNSDTRTIIVANNNDQEVVRATYTTTEGSPDGKSIEYKYPVDSTDVMQLVGLADIPTPGVVKPSQVPTTPNSVMVDLPPEIIHTPITSTEKMDLTVTAYVYDETPVQQVVLSFSKKADIEDQYFQDIVMQPTAANPLIFKAVIPQSELQNATELEYYITAKDSQNKTSRVPTSSTYNVHVKVPVEPENLSLNLSDNQYVRGNLQVKGMGGSLSDLQLKIDSQSITNTGNLLMLPAKIIFEGSGIEGSKGYKNGVYLNDQLIYTITKDLDLYAECEVPVPVNVLRAGVNKITVRSGNTVAPDDLADNHDDFTIRNMRLVLSDGTQLTDPNVPVAQNIKLGDGFPPNPATAVLSKDFNMSIPTTLANSLLYQWDTTQLADGNHKLTLTDTTNAFVPIQVTVQLDNTLPVLSVASPVNNQSYKGTIPLTYEAKDIGSGVKKIQMTLDGSPIADRSSLRAVDLQPGAHLLKVTVEDNAGNVTVKEVNFTSAEENPRQPQLVVPADQSVDVSTNPILKVKVEDPTGDALNATFLKANKYDFKDGLSHKAYTNATNMEPPLELTPAGEKLLTSDQIQAISAPDGQYMITDDTEKFPYQRYEFIINEQLMSAKTVDAIWKGHSLPGRRVALYGFNHTTSQWQELDWKIAQDENDFTLKGAISVADMVRDHKANVIVQDLIPSPQAADQYNFGFVWMPDTQFYSKTYPNIYDVTSQWIVDQASAQKFKYVIHTGDIVDDGFRPEQWVNANKSMKILDDAHIPYGVLAGNHDVQPNIDKPIDYSEYVKWFGADRFANRSYYGGQFQNNRDHYDLISANGYDFVIVYMGWQPEQQDLDWANGVLKKYADRNAIIALHQYMDGNGKYGGPAEEVYKQLILPNKNVFLVVNGHHTNTPKHNMRTIGDRTVHEVFTNYQTQPEGGMGYMRLLKFDTANNVLYMNTYSPYKNDYDWFDVSLDELALPVKLLPIQKRVATDYISIQARTNEVIGDKVIAAPSGSEVSATWNGLQNNKLYNWYVKLEDSFEGMAESDIYTFVTKPLSSNANLSALTLSNGVLSPSFASGTTSYTSQVSNAVYSVTVTASVYDSNATTITVNGNPAESNQPSGAINLNEGSNPIAIVAVAQNGISQTYTVNVTRAAAANGSADLSGLTLSGGTLSPAFASGTTAYTSNVPNGVSNITVTASVYDSKATMTVNGNPAASGQESGAVNLNVGSNAITIVVTAKNGTSKTYTVNVTRASAANNNKHSGSSGSGGAPANSGTIQATSGGTLTLIGAQIDVPAGATDNNIQVTVEKVSDTSILPVDNVLKLLSDVYEIKKDKDGDFSKPVVITLSFDKTKVDFTKSTVGLYWLNEQTHKWIQLDDLQVVQAKATVSGSVKHFTKFAVLASEKTEAVKPPANEVDFADIKGHWAESNVRELVKLGAINGYPDNTFKPDNNITRAEFVSVIVKAFNLKVQDGKNFADTSTHWAKSEIGTAAALGVVAGYSDSTFGPDDLITREQMAAIVIRAAQIDSADKNISFSDSSNVSDWARTALAAATAKGLVKGYEDGTVKPKANSTRAEAVTVILRALQLKK
ncbi:MULTISPECIES: S-layer homology domain-containing protein [unclassified Paenibacillus]|uniref:S-layer homology domain-containing protein n=1 Tax=unclassified Paenibacillus TaxID=185978 RepID=UPI003639449D